MTDQEMRVEYFRLLELAYLADGSDSEAIRLAWVEAENNFNNFKNSTENS